jgi:hypothetical protein
MTKNVASYLSDVHEEVGVATQNQIGDWQGL